MTKFPMPICTICGHIITHHKVVKVYGEDQWMVDCSICLETDEEYVRGIRRTSVRFGRCTRKVDMKRYEYEKI